MSVELSELHDLFWLVRGDRVLAWTAIVFGLVASIIGIGVVVVDRVVARALAAWQLRSGCQILEQRRCWTFYGPFGGGLMGFQEIYRVVVIDKASRRVEAYARVGNFWGGTWFGPRTVEVRTGSPDDFATIG